MAFVLGEDIYAATGVNRPNPKIEEIARRWKDISDETQLKIYELMRADSNR